MGTAIGRYLSSATHDKSLHTLVYFAAHKKACNYQPAVPTGKRRRPGCVMSGMPDPKIRGWWADRKREGVSPADPRNKKAGRYSG
jgi:hypothetical protein